MSGLDVVGIGALNLDYIVDATDLSVPFEPGTESVVEEATIHEVLDSCGSAPLEVTLGGSAYNAIFALAQMRSDLKLGCVGVAGLLPRPGVSSVEELRRNGVDTSLIYETDEALSGVCLSLVHSGERTLLTHAGANDLMAEKLDQHFPEVLAHLQRARVVHVTSFLDDATPKVLLRVLRALRASRPDVLITFDPGHVWASEPTDEILEIIGTSNFLVLNGREFLALGGLSVLSFMEEPQAVVVVKKADGITLFRNGSPGHHLPGRPLSDDEIADSTGAGDVFAAGLLWSLTRSPPQVETGARLGMALARRTLTHVGTRGHGGFAELAQRFFGPGGDFGPGGNFFGPGRDERGFGATRPR